MNGPADGPAGARLPAFLVSIDTEGDDVWSRPREVTTRNARTLPRFQDLCERFGVRPTYLVNHEMVRDEAFRAFGRDVLARGAAEIGMHLHAWDTPPIEPLGARDWHDQPYATEFPPGLVARKAELMTRLLADAFGRAPTSHRAGRWGFDGPYAATLLGLGYEVDCSVTPGVTWRRHPGRPGGAGGPDYTGFPSAPYRLDPDDIARPGTSALLEVPMTILPRPRPLHRELARRLLGRTGPRLGWLRPEGGNLADMLAIVDEAARAGRPCIQFTLHSSEFMPGGSPTFRTPESIEALYRDLDILFAAIRGRFAGMTLTEFARSHPVIPGPAPREPRTDGVSATPLR